MDKEQMTLLRRMRHAFASQTRLGIAAPFPFQRWSWSQFAGYATMALLLVIIGLPVFWMLTGAFKTRGEIQALPPVWIPSAFDIRSFQDVRDAFGNFTRAWDQAPFGRFYINSLIITSLATIGSVFNATLCAYALAFLKFPFKNVIFIIILAALMIPAQVTVLPNYIFLGGTLRDLFGVSWVNTFQGIIVPGMSTAFGTFLLRQGFKALPGEVLDAAKVDGCNHIRMMWDMVLPMAKPVVITYALLAMVYHWNDYLWPLVMTTNNQVRPLTVGLSYLIDVEGNTNYGVLMAGTVFVIAPMILVYIWAQRYIIDGMTAGATKG